MYGAVVKGASNWLLKAVIESSGRQEADNVSSELLQTRPLLGQTVQATATSKTIFDHSHSSVTCHVKAEGVSDSPGAGAQTPFALRIETSLILLQPSGSFQREVVETQGALTPFRGTPKL